jgi:hypothetical protein
MARLLRLSWLTGLTRLPWRRRRHQETGQNERLLENGAARLLENGGYRLLENQP